MIRKGMIKTPDNYNFVCLSSHYECLFVVHHQFINSYLTRTYHEESSNKAGHGYSVGEAAFRASYLKLQAFFLHLNTFKQNNHSLGIDDIEWELVTITKSLQNMEDMYILYAQLSNAEAHQTKQFHVMGKCCELLFRWRKLHRKRTQQQVPQ